MVMFASHLRFKHATASANELCRFWAYLLKDYYSPYGQKLGLTFEELSCLEHYAESASQKGVAEYLK
jgi:hypothetical protein